MSNTNNRGARRQQHRSNGDSSDDGGNDVELSMAGGASESGGETDTITKPLLADEERGGSNGDGIDDADDGTEKKKKKPPLFGSALFSSSTSGTVRAASACALYSSSAVSMIVVNKSLASSYNHLLPPGVGDLNVLLVVFQAATAVACVEGCRLLKIIEPYPSLSRDTVRKWAPVNVLFCLMLFTGMAAFANNSVPMVTVFKNIASLTTGVGDYLIFGNKTEPLGILAFVVMLVGALLAAANDISVTPLGLFWMVSNCLASSGYLLYMKHATNTIQLSKFGMVYVNNLLGVCLLLPVAYATGQIALLAQTPALHSTDYAFKNLFAGLVGFFLNFASLNCVQTTGPSTFALVGSLNKIPVTFIGYLLFSDPVSATSWFFIGVNFCGGFLYSYAKLRTSRKLAGAAK